MDSNYSHLRKRFRDFTIFLPFLLWGSAPVFAQMEFDHASGNQGSTALLEFKPGQTVTFAVKNTSLECFDFNASSITTPPPPPGAAPALALTTKSWSTTHQRGVTAYKVTVTKKAAPDARCGDPVKVAGMTLVNREWTVPVTTLGWTVGVSAAFTIDELTNPQFALEAATVDGTDGFNVIEDKSARDSTTRGLAIFMHLSNSAWNTRSISWAPVSLGIGFDDTTRYYLGTSAQFGESFFLTAGKVFGNISRLPNGVSVGDFTTNANALSTLGKHSDDAWFVGFSYQFLSAGIDAKLKGLVSGSSVAAPPAK